MQIKETSCLRIMSVNLNDNSPVWRKNMFDLPILPSFFFLCFELAGFVDDSVLKFITMPNNENIKQ